MSKRTITLTGRPPVTIVEENWPVLCSASDHLYDGEYEFQSFRHTRYFVGVRQHADGRAIVYATYSHVSNFLSERDSSSREGMILESPSTEHIIRAIHDVADHLGSTTSQEETWLSLAKECIADLPAVELE